MILAAALAACAGGEPPPAAAPPNIVLIIADDMNWDDSGVYGNPNVRTPNIDQLAADGMRFTNAFLTASSCSPSRSSIITGRYPHNTGAEQLHWPLPAEQVTFVEKLKDAGYWTALAGKWHLGDAIKERFDDVREADPSGFQLPTGEDGEALAMVSTADASGASEWIDVLRSRPDDQPFFLWFAALDPHRDYEEGIIDNPHKPEDVRIPPYTPDTPKVRKDFALYYDEITRLDDYVGKVVAELEAQGVADNTLVLFFSDNGRPFPRAKVTVYDEGIKTPWIVKWPGHVAPGSVNERLVSSVDIAPTALELAGVPLLDTFEGKSFAPLLSDAEAKTRDYVFAERHWHDFEDHIRAVRDERWKLIRNDYPDLPATPSADAGRSLTNQEFLRLEEEGKLPPEQRATFIAPRPQWELYDTQADPFEMSNLAADEAHAAELERLQAALEEWSERTGDYLPTKRTPDEFDRVTGDPTPARIRPRPSKMDMYGTSGKY